MYVGMHACMQASMYIYIYTSTPAHMFSPVAQAFNFFFYTGSALFIRKFCFTAFLDSACCCRACPAGCVCVCVRVYISNEQLHAQMVKHSCTATEHVRGTQKGDPNLLHHTLLLWRVACTIESCHSCTATEHVLQVQIYTHELHMMRHLAGVKQCVSPVIQMNESCHTYV